MSYFSVARAVGVRLMFAAHGVIALWRLTLATNEQRYWYLGLVLCLLLVEMTITLGKTGGKEWKWFCPSVFIYLMCIVPTMWFMELYELDKRLSVSDSTANNNSDVGNETTPTCVRRHQKVIPGQEKVNNDSGEALSTNLGSVMGVNFEITIPIKLTADQWIRTLEQILLLILILGRWFLPKGKLTHDQLSQLLLVYIGTAADIVEFFEAFKEDKVRNNRIICIVIMGIWSLSLIQFSLVLTASRVRRDRTGLIPHKNNIHLNNKTGCCDSDVYGITISIFLQDLPFLVLRMLLIIKYHVLSYTNMFFTCKNTIVIILLVYRLIVVQIERRRAAEDPDTAYMLPKFDSSPTMFDSKSNYDSKEKRRRRVKHPDTLSLSTCNTVSTCSSTPGSRIRLINPYDSCRNIYDVRQPGCGTPTAGHGSNMNMSKSCSSRALGSGSIAGGVGGCGSSNTKCGGSSCLISGCVGGGCTRVDEGGGRGTSGGVGGGSSSSRVGENPNTNNPVSFTTSPSLCRNSPV